MARAISPDTTNRRALLKGVIAASLAGSALPAQASQDDAELFRIEAEIFRENELSHQADDEIARLDAICRAGLERRREELGVRSLTNEEFEQRLDEMPEARERDRLIDVHYSHLDRMNALIQQMWAIPARTPEAREAKFLVLIGCVLEDRFRDGDWEADWDVKIARDLLIEFVGGEPAKRQRDQFAEHRSATAA